MCGFVIVARGNEANHRMLGRLTRRGPDGIGFWTDGMVTMAHARLEIVGHQDQPFQQCAFNGELYGHRDETLLMSNILDGTWNAKWGEDGDVGAALRELNGFWAAVHYNKATGQIKLARDQFGIRPLYYTLWDGELFVAGSTLCSVLDQLPNKPSLDWKALAEWAKFQFMLGPRTFFKGINRVMPGEVVTYDLKSGGLTHDTYEDIWQKGTEEATEEWFKTGHDLLRSAGMDTRCADVPFASTCSGGLDSSLVTRLTDPEHAFHANFSDPECNETFYARQVTEGTNTRLLVVNAQEEFDLCERVQDIVKDFDDPAIGSVILPLDDLMRAVHNRRYKVLLLGTGGDELFGGYVRYDIMLGVCAHDSYRDMYERTRSIAAPALRYEALHAKGNAAIFRFGDSGKASEAFQEAYEAAGDPITFDRRHFLPGLLTIDDRMSGRWGIEGRPSLLHQSFVRHVARLDPTKLTANGLKSVAKKLFASHLPAAVLDRQDKMGFTTPIGTFTTQQVGRIKEVLYSSKHRDLFDLDKVRWTTENKFSREVFGLVLLNAWLEEYA